MTSDEPVNVVRALWSARTWRATTHAAAGLVLAMLTVVLLGLWFAAVLSLAEGPTGGTALAIWYAAVTIAGLALLPAYASTLGTVHRARFRTLLDVAIATPPRGPGSWPARWTRAWRDAATWRQVTYHLWVLVVGGPAGAIVVLCWSAVIVVPPLGWSAVRPTFLIAGTGVALGLLLAAPWVARGFGYLDTRVAVALLGPSRAEELTVRVAALARSRADIVAATDAERRRIERDLHDGAQQRLVSLAMNLGMVRERLDGVPEPVRVAIAQAHDEAIAALTELREFVRGLHPAVLDDRGLDAALSGIVARAPIPVRLTVDVATRCSPTIEAVAYFVVSEALTNVVKHAGAGTARVSVVRTGDLLRVTVTDDGHGGAVADPSTGTGLSGLARRAAAVDGTLHLRSPAGGPTVLTVELPCAS